MAKMRVYELAKEMGKANRDILAVLNENGFAVKSHSSSIEDEAIALIRSHFKISGGMSPAVSTEVMNNDEDKVAKRAINEEKQMQETGENIAKESASKVSDMPEQANHVKPDEEKTLGREQTVGQSTTSDSDEKTSDRKKKLKPKKKNVTTVINRKYLTNKMGIGEGKGSDKHRRERGTRQRQERDNRKPARQEESRKIIRVRPESERTVRPKATQPRPQEEEILITAPVEEVSKKPMEAASRGNEKSKGNASQASGTPAVSDATREMQKNKASSKDSEQGQFFRKGQQNQKNANGAKGQNTQRGMNNQKGADGSKKQSSGASSGKPQNGKDAGKNRKRKKDRDALGKKQERYVNLEKKERNKRSRNQGKQPQERASDEILTLILPERLTIKDLADKIQVAPSAIVKKLFMKGTMVTVNQSIEYEQAEEIALEFNCICEPEEKVDVIAELLREEEEDPATMVTRPPVVCVMGHVDHGKTSLLDAIRDTRVTAREAGGITQKIGAYTVSIDGQSITFLDTPGHEAFTAMRMRGANSTDIAILVVAADDGVMPQTVEAINHAKAANIEIIVAINKIDKPNANIERVKQELSEYELIPTDWGGSTEFVPVSAHTHEGIDELLEMILLTSEVLELKSNPKRNARGLVIEAELDKGRGAVATVLVQKGTLKVGDPIAAGSSFGRVRAMIDDNGEHVKKAGPSKPVEIFGLSEVPNAGEIFVAMDSEKEARSFAQTFISESKNRLVEESRMKMSLDDLFNQIKAGNLKELDIIVKADVQGSVEAVRQSLEKLSNDEVVVKVIHGGVGAITESDVTLASASNAIIIGFNVRPDAVAKQTADQEGVDVRLYKVIYNAIEDVEAAMKGMLEPVYEEKVIGHAEVRQIFRSSDVGNIAGSFILDGSLVRDCKIRITREGEQIYEGSLSSLKRFKDDVKEVKAGYECGLVFAGFDAIAEEDQIEGYIMVEVPRDRL